LAKVQIKQMRGGKEYDATFGKRMRGEGEFADLLAMRYQLACRRHQLNLGTSQSLTTGLFRRPSQNPAQFDMWDV
jgi:hypothetical protein